MATKNQFTSVSKIKEAGLVHANVDNKILEVCLMRVQDIQLKNILGTCLLKDLDLRIEDKGGPGGDEGFDADTNTLMTDYIFPFLVAWVDARASKFQLKQIRNKTTGKNSDETITALTENEMIAMKDDLIKDANSYGRDLKGFLEDNKEKYPLYCDCDCNEENVQPQKGTYTKVFY